MSPDDTVLGGEFHARWLGLLKMIDRLALEMALRRVSSAFSTTRSSKKNDLSFKFSEAKSHCRHVTYAAP